MEDCNTLVADCVVLSCCCQCLILQLLVFLLLQLPRKMARRTREYAKKKLGKKRKKGKAGEKDLARARGQEREGVGNEVINNYKMHEWGGSMEEVEKVLEELSRKGEFAFGSFWGRGNLERGRVMSCSKCVVPHELDYGGHVVVNFQLIEVVGL